MRRRDFVTLVSGTAMGWPIAARAQQAERMQRVGVLMPDAAENDSETSPRVTALRQGLLQLGWTEGRNVRLEHRWSASDADSMRKLARELVDLRPDVILTDTTPVTAAVLGETPTIYKSNVRAGGGVAAMADVPYFLSEEEITALAHYLAHRWSQPVDATLYLKEEMECMVMGQGFHRGFTAAEKTELWDRWKRGESLKAIGRAFGKPSSSIYFFGGSAWWDSSCQRRSSRLALTLAEREVMSRGVTGHQSARSIARLLGRSPSTVSREMSRNGGCDRYRAALADERPKCCKLANSPRLRPAA